MKTFYGQAEGQSIYRNFFAGVLYGQPLVKLDTAKNVLGTRISLQNDLYRKQASLYFSEQTKERRT